MNPRANTLSSTVPGSVSSTNGRQEPADPRPAGRSSSSFSERAAQARAAPSKPAPKGPERGRPEHNESAPDGSSRGMLLLGDGAMLASLGILPAPSAPKASPKGLGIQPSGAGGAGLESLSAGRGDGGAAYLHAKVAHDNNGRFSGVELHAVEQHGRVTIQLSAPDAAGESSLRAALADLRASLASRGLEGVLVELAPRGGGSSHGSPHDAPPHERPRDAAPEDADETSHPIRARRPAHRAAPDAHGDATECW